LKKRNDRGVVVILGKVERRAAVLSGNGAGEGGWMKAFLRLPTRGGGFFRY
jgi:hypothetical protein